jgi:SAM-dependent methyltransferase
MTAADTSPMGSFADLVAEAMSAPINGWDFSWLEGRATEERPWWGYRRLAAQEVAAASTVLDIQTGGGELLAEILLDAAEQPAVVVVTESWPPNVARARHNLEPFGAWVTELPEGGDLPFDDGTFDLVLSRHPVETSWEEVARVLRPGGVYLAQHVGAGSNRELVEFLMGPQPVSGRRSPERAVIEAQAAGLWVLDLRADTLRVEFFDVGSVVYFLRLVVWTVPDFSVERYHERLLALHRHIEQEGSFVTYSRRFLIEAAKPG